MINKVALLPTQQPCGCDWHEADACSACHIAPSNAEGESIYLTLLVNLYFLRFAMSSIKWERTAFHRCKSGITCLPAWKTFTK